MLVQIFYNQQHITFNNRITCRFCGRKIKIYQRVNANIFHSITHEECFNHENVIIDKGTLREMIDKYPAWFPVKS